MQKLISYKLAFSTIQDQRNMKASFWTFSSTFCFLF